jgi:hypothetical protein
MPKFSVNHAMFEAVRALNLPLGHYAITTGGALGIRDIRLINDVDLITDDELWALLTRQYPVTRANGFDRIIIGPHIEIFGRDSFLASRTTSPTAYEQIRTADIIDGLPFVRLEHILHFKKNILSRDPHRYKHANDQFDIRIIESLLTAVA